MQTVARMRRRRRATVTHPRAISKLLMSFLIFHISTLRSEVVSSPLVVILVEKTSRQSTAEAADYLMDSENIITYSDSTYTIIGILLF